MPLWTKEKSKAKLVLCFPNSEDKLYRYAFNNRTMDGAINLFTEWVRTRKFGNHGTAQIYDNSNGKLLMQFDKDGNITKNFYN